MAWQSRQEPQLYFPSCHSLSSVSLASFPHPVEISCTNFRLQTHWDIISSWRRRIVSFLCLSFPFQLFIWKLSDLLKIWRNSTTLHIYTLNGGFLVTFCCLWALTHFVFVFLSFARPFENLKVSCRYDTSSPNTPVYISSK